MLYWCREIAKLSVVAVHVDTGFVSTQALENIRSAVSALGVDYVNLELQDNLLKNLYRLFLARTGDFCSPCNAALGAATAHFALDNKVGLIVNGLSPNESFSDALAHFDNEYFLDVINNEIPQENLRPYILGRTERDRVKVLSLPYHIVWNEDKIAYLIERKLGWRPMVDHGDCLASPVKNYLWMRRWGFGKLTVKLSGMIRDGYITRVEALRRLAEEETAGEPPILPYFLSELSMSREAFKAAAGVNVTTVIQSHESNLRRLEAYGRQAVYDRDMVRWVLGRIILPNPIYRAVRLVWPNLARALER